MLKEVKSIERSAGLDRAAWHKPLISIVITHFNYADHIEDAILSLLDQTYQNWECVIVDDASSYEQHARLVAILESINSPKIRLVEHAKNRGQIHAFFTGLDATSGEFVGMLDPDDRYAKTFLNEALRAHLNNIVMCPIVSTDQCLVKNDSVIAMVNSHHLLEQSRWIGGRAVIDDETASSLFYTPPDRPGWHWTSTSSLMMRRSALQYLKPNKELITKNSVDAYVAQGLHRLGGTIFLARPLVYRTLHDRNDYISDTLFSSLQHQARPTAVSAERKLLLDAIEALEHNGAPIPSGALKPKKPGLLAKWRRSVNKRWQKFFGNSAR
jgi:glycosyltransferase involved in cell wall biosynthesis